MSKRLTLARRLVLIMTVRRWVDAGEHAKIQTNGTFIVDGLAK